MFGITVKHMTKSYDLNVEEDMLMGRLWKLFLFSFASYKVIALPTIATAIVVALTRS